MLTAIVILGILAIIANGMTFVKKELWWIRIFDFPRAQLTAIATVLLVLFFFWYDPRNILHNVFLGMLGLSILYQLFCILPYTPLWRTQVLNSSENDPAIRVSLLIMNILMTNRNSRACLDMVGELNPDILLILEADDWWAHALEVLEPDFPHQVKYPLKNTYGILLYSKLELRDCHLQHLVEDDVPSIHGKVALGGGEEIQLHCVHPRPPGHGDRPGTIPRDAELLLVGREVRHSDLPAIVMGDFNDVAWSHTTTLFQRISGLLDPRIGRGLFSTFHALTPFLRFPLDHVFHSAHFQLVRYQRLGYIGSDHLPLLCVLKFVPNDLNCQSAASVMKEHHEEAERKIRIAEPNDLPDI